jgi:Icc-related predicted phosphoesterase
MEFAPIQIQNAGSDTLILSGDICVADYFTRSPESPHSAVAETWRKWFEDTCARFEHVIYVLGNHEHYKGRFYETCDVLCNTLGHISNLYLLDQSIKEIGGVTFYGSTLWTDFDNDNLKAMAVRDALNDYKLVQGRNYRKLTTQETALYHQRAVADISALKAEKIVVVGHHSPSYRSTDDRYRSGQWAYLNSGYASHLDAFIEKHPQIVLWTHGHMHNSADYMIGGTRIVANPRGYQRAEHLPPENANFNPNLIWEI